MELAAGSAACHWPVIVTIIVDYSLCLQTALHWNILSAHTQFSACPPSPAPNGSCQWFASALLLLLLLLLLRLVPSLFSPVSLSLPACSPLRSLLSSPLRSSLLASLLLLCRLVSGSRSGSCSQDNGAVGLLTVHCWPPRSCLLSLPEQVRGNLRPAATLCMSLLSHDVVSSTVLRLELTGQGRQLLDLDVIQQLPAWSMTLPSPSHYSGRPDSRNAR